MATYLNDNAVGQGGVGIDVADLSLAIAKVQLHDALVDLLLPMNLLHNKQTYVRHQDLHLNEVK